MSVNYLSTELKDSPYILPVDMDLLDKVLDYKQTAFYQNAQKVGDQIHELQNSDIANPLQKAALTNKVNGLTSAINNFGSVDYSDQGVTNTLQNYASDIYNDPTIINGIASTKQIRLAQASVDKLKTDPKLAKYYSPSNEYVLNQQIGQYTGGGIDASYNGPTSIKPYMGNPAKIAADALAKIKPDITEKLDPNGDPTGYYTLKSTGETVSPERIKSLLDAYLDPGTLEQIHNDAAYTLIGMGGGQFTKDNAVGQYAQIQSRELANAQGQLSDLATKLRTDPSNSNVAQWQNLYQQTQAKINGLTTKNADGTTSINTKDFEALYDSNPTEAGYKIYKDALINDVVNGYGYTATKITATANLAKKAEQEAYLKAAEIGKGATPYQLSDGTWAINVDNVVGKKGKDKKQLVDANGDPYPEGSAYRLTSPNTLTPAQLQSSEIDENTINTKNLDLANQQNTILRNGFLSDFANKKFSNLVTTDVETNPGSNYISQNSPFLTLLQQNAGGNLEKGLNDLTNNPTFKKDAQAGKGTVVAIGGQNVNLTPDEVKYFQNVQGTWNNASQAVDPSKLNDVDLSKSEVTKQLTAWTLLQQSINTNNNLVNQTFAHVAAANGVTDQNTLNAVREAIKDGYEVPSGIHGDIDFSSDVVNPKYTLVNKLGKEKYDQIKADAKSTFEKAPNRDNYTYTTLPTDDKYQNESGIRSFIATAAKSQLHEDVSPDDVKALAYNRDAAKGQYGVLFSYKDKDKNTVQQYVLLDKGNEAALGITAPSHPELDDALNFDIKTQPIPLWSQSFSRPFSVVINRNGNSRNGNSFYASVLIDGKEVKYNANGYSATASDAYDNIESVLNSSQLPNIYQAAPEELPIYSDTPDVIAQKQANLKNKNIIANTQLFIKGLQQQNQQ